LTFTIPLPSRSLSAIWKVKIRNDERGEEPHVSVIFKGSGVYRFGLRKRAFLDRDPDPRNVPADVVGFILAHLDEFVAAWDRMYPENVVWSQGGEDDD